MEAMLAMVAEVGGYLVLWHTLTYLGNTTRYSAYYIHDMYALYMAS